MDLRKYPEEKHFTDRSKKAIRLFHEIAQAINDHGWRAGFLSGFAIDAHFSYLTRSHRDVDIFISEEEAKLLGKHLANLGHEIYESPRSKGEMLKVDRADPTNPSQTLCDVHYFWEEDGKTVIPLHGKKLVFSGGFSRITEEKEFLGEKIKVLTPEYLLEEKKGWREQVGLDGAMDEERRKAYEADMDKIYFLLKN